jgi:hypothetical protein
MNNSSLEGEYFLFYIFCLFKIVIEQGADEWEIVGEELAAPA